MDTTLVQTTIIAYLDYCNSLVISLFVSILALLQSILNIVVRGILSKTDLFGYLVPEIYLFLKQPFFFETTEHFLLVFKVKSYGKCP